MSRLLRTLTITGLALVALASFAISATATRGIRLSPGGEITKRVEAFTVRAFGGEVTIICRLTLRGRIANVIEKAFARRLPEGRIGRIEFAATEGCVTNFGGFAEVIILVSPEAPFNLRYESFLGLLPAITGINFRKLAFELQVFEPIIIGACLFRGPVNLLLTFPPVEEPLGRFNPERFVTPNALPHVGGGICPEIVELSGAGRVTPAQTAALFQ